ncbi:MAG: ankyrin repeat domain-containing protein [Legionella sp.]|uniref:ankyrin repeat domain-containing protein n=1 Tax=Legionella sp. TaxID=459 RepID=UPI00284C1297|nr:ankyrin repeat domain-containing protein [Legionella sp.]
MFEKNLSEIKNVYDLIRKMDAVHESSELAARLAKKLAEDSESFSRIFQSHFVMLELMRSTSKGVIKNTLFNLMLSDTHFFRMFPSSHEISIFYSNLKESKKNTDWQHLLDETDINEYKELFLKKILAPETLQHIVMHFDIEQLMDDFPVIKNVIERSLELRQKRWSVNLSDIRDVYGLSEKIYLLEKSSDELALERILELLNNLREDKANFARIFESHNDITWLFFISHGEIRDVIFNLVLSGDNFFRLFPTSKGIIELYSHWSGLSATPYALLDINSRLVLRSFMQLFVKKLRTPETFQEIMMSPDRYDIGALLECIPEIKETIDSIPEFRSKLPSAKAPVGHATLFTSPEKNHMRINNDFSHAVYKRRRVTDDFSHAVYKNDINEVTRCLKQGADISTTIEHNMRAIEFVCTAGYFEIMKLLVENGADIKYRSKFGWTLLHMACGSQSNKAIVAYLLETKLIDINAKTEPNINEEQFTALDIAYRWNHPEVIVLLLQHGAKLARDSDISQKDLEIILKSYKSSSFMGFLSTLWFFSYFIPPQRSQAIIELNLLLNYEHISHQQIINALSKDHDGIRRVSLFKQQDNITKNGTSTDDVIYNLSQIMQV